MTISETSYAQIETLVKKFKSLPTQRRRTYNESDTRKDFILTLFRALLWNIEDSAEVASEEKISRGYVDYSFRLNGLRRFVLETKSLHEGLKDDDYIQARDYAYHKGLTWAVLSDFASLQILNAEVKEPNFYQAIFKSFDVDDYLSRFDELWWLSRPAMAEGILDRAAEKAFKKTKRVPITENLFDNLKEWRNALFKNLRAYNRGKLYTPRLIDDAVQRILDRLIFIRTAEDRGVESDSLRALVRELQASHKTNRLVRELNARFRQLDAAYNSQLFAPHYSEDLEYEPQTLINIIEGLYASPTNFVSYNFALIDADVLGRVYEQYLGYVLLDTGVEMKPSRILRQAQDASLLQPKKSKRKSQGIYYTPSFVVKYIVQQTLGRYLQTHGDNLSQPVRVLDLACGSGVVLDRSV
jgi:type I restriction-modification system DNA methylase subunit